MPELQGDNMRLITPWNNVSRPPSTREHPDIPGLYLNYYVNKMGQLIPLWPDIGPMKWDDPDD